MSWNTSGKIKYVIEVIDEDHPMHGDYKYDVRKMARTVYYGEGRFCRNLSDVMRYLESEEKRKQGFTN